MNYFVPYLKQGMYVDEIECLLRTLKSIISDIYEQTWDFWWDVYIFYLNSSVLRSMSSSICSAWNEYFSEDEPYEDWIDVCRIQDWREIRNVADCFEIIPSLKSVQEEKGEIDPFDRFTKLLFVPIQTIFGEECCLEIETYCNEIGKIVLKKTMEKLTRKHLPNNTKKQYQMFYQIRNEEFNGLKKREEEKFYKTDIKLSDSLKKTKKHHVYAIICKETVATRMYLSGQKRQGRRNF